MSVSEYLEILEKKKELQDKAEFKEIAIKGVLERLRDDRQRQLLIEGYNLSEEEGNRIQIQNLEELEEYLKEQDLHFASSAVLPLYEMLKKEGVLSNKVELLIELLLLDLGQRSVKPSRN